eukprot:Gb_19096 [translate_table: standard]
MPMDPFVQTRPTEEVATQGHNRVLNQFQIDISFKASSITIATRGSSTWWYLFNIPLQRLGIRSGEIEKDAPNTLQRIWWTLTTTDSEFQRQYPGSRHQPWGDFTKKFDAGASIFFEGIGHDVNVKRLC